jgi:hypothetical protein
VELDGTFTQEEIDERIYGSKIVVISEQAMLNVIYVIKSCVLIMYTRLTVGLSTQKFVKYLAIYVAIGWVATEIAFFTACRPFTGYWGMPPPDPQCTTLQHYSIVQACFNISSDTLMLFIPLPLVFQLNMVWKQKIVLVFIFSLGIFVILAAVLTKYFNLSDVYSTTYMLWYVREASVAVYVSNLPMIWPLLREWFPFLRALNPAGVMPTATGRRGTRPTPGGSKVSQSQPTTKSSSEQELYGPTNRGIGAPRRGSTDTLGSTYIVDIEMKDKRADGSSSTERIVPTGVSRSQGKGHSAGTPSMGGIQVLSTVTVEEEEMTGRKQQDVDLEKALYDWNHAGGSKHQASAFGHT